MTLPPLHFRRREGGATVFRVAETDGRLDLTPLAQIAVRAAEVRPSGGRTPTDAEARAMDDWLAAERAASGARLAADCAAALGRTAHWVQGTAEPDEVRAVSDDLLLAMHDLRQAILRRLGEPPRD